MATLKVNSTNLPEPQKLTFQIADVDYDSGRVQSGKMKRNRVRGGSTAVHTVEATFPPMGATEMASLLHAIDGASMTLTCLDPYTGTNGTFTVYVGDRSMPVWSKFNGVWQYESMTVTFVEF